MMMTKQAAQHETKNTKSVIKNAKDIELLNFGKNQAQAAEVKQTKCPKNNTI